MSVRINLLDVLVKKKYLFDGILAFLLYGTLTLTISAQDKSEHIYSIPNLSFEIEMRRLDDIAERLKTDPDKNIYLVAYNQKGKKISTATDRLKKSKNYLTEKHRISHKRIITVYGGTKDEGNIIMEIFLVDKISISPVKSKENSSFTN